MSSTPSSSSSSAPSAHDLIDEILNTKADNPDFDLSRFIVQIDELVVRYEAKLRKKKPIREKLGELPSATDAANFADQVSTNVKLIANEEHLGCKSNLASTKNISFSVARIIAEAVV